MLVTPRIVLFNKSLLFNKRVLINSSRTYLLDTSSGGLNSFTKREQAQENQFIRNLEKEQLAHIREEIKRHKEELASLENKINEISKRHNKEGDEAKKK
ncbi:ATPase-binding protein PWA37_001677 [Arxiozyma heterogenica]|uniref:ATPase-binding protein n=1 Tax=Arxiozyma heterogenica TaxID=278026 RepID=UPI002F22D72C